MSKGTIFTTIDLSDTLGFVAKKNKRFQAMMLSQIEEIVGKDSTQFILIRKIILDGMNNYTRSVVRNIFGDIEDIIR